MLKKIAVTAALSAALVLGGSAGAHAVIVPPVEPYAGQQTESNTVAPGAALPFTSAPTGLSAGTVVSLQITGPSTVTFATATLSASQATVGADGTFQFSVTVPADATPGTVYTVTASGEDSDSVFTLDLTVTVAAAAVDSAAPNNALPNTGSADTGALVWFGVGALALGIGAVTVVAVKRRPTAATTTATTITP